MGLKKKVLLIDDHPLFRAGIKSLLDRNPSFEVVGEAGTGQEGLRSARELRPDLVILDIALPDQNGMEIARELRVLFSEVRILMVSMHAKIDYITESFRAGALGYVVKNRQPIGWSRAWRRSPGGNITWTAPSPTKW